MTETNYRERFDVDSSQIDDPFDDWIDDRIKSIRDKVHALMSVEAQKVVNEYWDYRTAENEKRKHCRSEQTMLGLRVHRIDENYYSLEWYDNKDFRFKREGGKAYSTTLSKKPGNNYYTRRELKSHARSWELFFVFKIEDRLSLYREQYTLFLEIISALKKIKRTRVKLKQYSESSWLDNF
jgi:MobI protein